MTKGITSIALSTLISACTTCDYGGLSKLPLDSSVPQEYRENVAFVKEVRKFGIEQLGLYRCTQHYTAFSKTDQEARMLYRLFVARQDVLPNTWEELSRSFENPTNYREDVRAMFFTSFTDTLEDEAAYYKDKGYDIFSRNVTDYNPPSSNQGSAITPNFLKDSRAWQAQTVLHEICHDSVEEWIGENFPSELNESFCGVIGRAGAMEYFKFKAGTDSDDYKQALENHNYHLNFSQKINQSYLQLQDLYQNSKPLPWKLEERQKIFAEIKDSLNFDANNAVLWDSYAYTQYYPLMLQLYDSEDKNVRQTLEIMKKCPEQKDKALKYVQEKIRKK